MESDHRWKTYRRRDALEHGPRERTGKRILVVDDNEAVCGMLRDLLAAHGHETRTQTDPRRVLEQLRDGDFDALILDLVMPKLSGLEVLR